MPSYKKKFSTTKDFSNTTGAVSPISGANSNGGAWNDPNVGKNHWNNQEFGYK
jgi:hypothetical protein